MFLIKRLLGKKQMLRVSALTRIIHVSMLLLAVGLFYNRSNVQKRNPNYINSTVLYNDLRESTSSGTCGKIRHV